MDPVHLDWLDGTSAVVPAIWLRDNCPCGECRVVATSERRKMIATEPLDLAPVSIMTDQRGVTVDWGTHRSLYSLDWYRAIRLGSKRQTYEPQLWSSEFDLATFDYRELDESTEVGRARVVDFLRAFARDGVVVVGGVPTYRGESERFVNRWAPIRELPFGRVHDVWVDPGGYNIAHTAEALPPHNDFPSYGWPPSGQALHMLVNEVAGGDSLVVDGWEVAARLDPDDVDVLAGFSVPFRQFDDGNETWTTAPILRRRPDGTIEHIRYSNQLMQPLDPELPGLERFYAAYHRLSALVLAEESQHRFRLDAGDLLLVHGHRVLHGRTAYEPGGGKRHLQDVYFEFEDLFNRLFRLEAADIAATTGGPV